MAVGNQGMLEDGLDPAACVASLMDGFSIETTPGASQKIPDYRAHLKAGTRVFITFLPGSDFDDTIATAIRLRREGLEPVPHLAARSIPSRDFLDAKLRRLVGEAGVREVLAIAGAPLSPLGEFRDTMQMLETGLLDRYRIRRIGVAGHPEGNPEIPDAAVAEALTWKQAFARRTDASVYVVTQFCFEAAPIIAWEQRLMAEGIDLPVHIGLPGLATIRSLLAHARACGIGPSTAFLTRRAHDVARLLRVSAPDRLVLALAEYRAATPASRIAGVHVYPLGGLSKSARWSYAAAEGRLVVNARGNGFRVDADLS